MSQIGENTYFAGRYKLLSRLGAGGFSVVWLAEDTMAGDTKVALKIYAPDKGLDKDGIDNFRKEYAITLNLNHSSLLSAKHFDVSEGSPYLIMQYMSNGSALKLVENIDEKQLGKFIFEVASGLEYLHNHDPAIVHQDIKPDNVLISAQGNFLLTDFGISTRVRRTLTKSASKVGYSGTIAYVPPERYMRNPKPQPVGDIFAFGIMLFELITGYLPWNEQGGLGFIGSQIIPPIEEDEFSDAVKDLTIACISFKPEDRPTAEEIRKYAQSYVQNGFWDPKLTPAAVKVVSQFTDEHDDHRAEEAIKKEAEETKKRKLQEDKNKAAAEESKKKEKLAKKANEDKNIADKAKTNKANKDDKFNSLISQANEKFNNGSYTGARDLYSSAIKLKSDPYASSQIEKCSGFIKQNHQTKKQNESERYVDNLLTKAEAYYSKGRHTTAKKHYLKILSNNADHPESIKRIKEIDTLLIHKKLENRRRNVKIFIPLIIIAIVSAAALYYFGLGPALPEAKFISDITTVEEGGSIQFQNLSINAASYKWSFPEGKPSISDSKNPVVSFEKPGKYTITLIAINENEEETSFSKKITVTEKEEKKEVVAAAVEVVPLPQPNFIVNKTSVIAGKSVTFTNKSKNADRVSWTFENGEPSTSNKKNPKVKYSQVGNHKVTLIAYNEAGKKTISKDNYIVVSKEIEKPVAKFEADTNKVYVGGQVQFNDLSSFVDTRTWGFPGGTPSESDEQNPLITYDSLGSFTVDLIVSNKRGEDQIKSSFVIEVTEDPEIILYQEFVAIVIVADSLYDASSSKLALTKYKAARAINSYDDHVNGRISSITSINRKENRYNDHLATAENLIRQNKYNEARAKYEDALKLKPNEEYPSEMLVNLDNYLADDNVYFEISKNSSLSAKQLIVSKTENTALVKISIGNIYDENELKLEFTTQWKDKREKILKDPDESIAIMKSYTEVSSPSININNFDNIGYQVFSHITNLTIQIDKSYEGGETTVSVDLRMVTDQKGEVFPTTDKYENKNPEGSVDITFTVDKMYKSKLVW